LRSNHLIERHASSPPAFRAEEGNCCGPASGFEGRPGGSNVLSRFLPVLLMVGMTIGCEESLPPRIQPEQFLAATLGVRDTVVTIDGGVATSGSGAFFLGLTNLYEDVLDGPARVVGRVEVWFRDNPSQRTTVVAGVLDVLNSGIIVGNTATLRVDSTMRMFKQWSHKTDSNIPFWEFVRMSPMVTPGGVPYCQSEPVHMVARASIQLFEHTAPELTGEIHFVLVYKVFGIQCL